jgi:hypothetical protein
MSDADTSNLPPSGSGAGASGPHSSGLGMYAVRSPQAAAAVRSDGWAATSMTRSGGSPSNRQPPR